jgi:hypothetical protein
MKVEPPVIKQVNQEVPERKQTASAEGPTPTHGGGTLKAVVEDLGPREVKESR